MCTSAFCGQPQPLHQRAASGKVRFPILSIEIFSPSQLVEIRNCQESQAVTRHSNDVLCSYVHGSQSHSVFTERCLASRIMHTNITKLFVQSKQPLYIPQ